jgi:Transporter associated domain
MNQPVPTEREYQTVAGFVLAHLRHLPKQAKPSRCRGGGSRWLISMDAASTKSWPCEFRSRVG